jgi:hypothetical protein
MGQFDRTDCSFSELGSYCDTALMHGNGLLQGGEPEVRARPFIYVAGPVESLEIRCRELIQSPESFSIIC